MTISSLSDGSKIIDCVMFRGLLLAATVNGIFYWDEGEWRRVELCGVSDRQMIHYNPLGPSRMADD